MTTTSRDPTNDEIASALDELGDLYELDGAIVHRVVAYRNAAKAVRESPVSVIALARQGRATELSGIGQTIQDVDILQTNPTVAAQVATTGIQTAKNLLTKKVKAVKATIKGGHQVLLKMDRMN